MAEEFLMAVARVSKVEEIPNGSVPILQSTLKFVKQEAAASGYIKNLDPKLTTMLVAGQLEFDKTYEVVIRMGVQQELPLRSFREDDDDIVVTPPSFKRPRVTWDAYDDSDEEDVRI